MKTIHRAVSLSQNAGLTVLDWNSATGSPLNSPKVLKRVKVPALRIVPAAANEDLFKYASAVKARSGYWETIAFTALESLRQGHSANAFFSV